jgi:hypothetical protein
MDPSWFNPIESLISQPRAHVISFLCFSHEAQALDHTQKKALISFERDEDEDGARWSENVGREITSSILFSIKLIK